MKQHRFELIHQGEEICHDDWAENEEEPGKCWWGIWKPEGLSVGERALQEKLQRRQKLEKLENREAIL